MILVVTTDQALIDECALVSTGTRAFPTTNAAAAWLDTQPLGQPRRSWLIVYGFDLFAADRPDFDRIPHAADPIAVRYAHPGTRVTVAELCRMREARVKGFVTLPSGRRYLATLVRDQDRMGREHIPIRDLQVPA